jgi:hypothetical protein
MKGRSVVAHGDGNCTAKKLQRTKIRIYSQLHGAVGDYEFKYHSHKSAETSSPYAKQCISVCALLSARDNWDICALL